MDAPAAEKPAEVSAKVAQIKAATEKKAAKEAKSKGKKGKSPKGKDKKLKRKSTRRGSREAFAEPAYTPYIKAIQDFCDFVSSFISGPKYDPHGPNPDESLAEYEKHLQKRGNCPFYLTFALILMIPVSIMSFQAYEMQMVCSAAKEVCDEECITSLESRLATSVSGPSQTVSGQNELVIECRADCDVVYFDCNRETYLLYLGIASLVISCPGTMCVTNIFDTVRKATEREREEKRMAGLEAKERDATAPKKRERYLSKRNSRDSSDQEEAKGTEPASPSGTRPTSPGPSDSPQSSISETELGMMQESCLDKCLARLRKCCSYSVRRLISLVAAPVIGCHKRLKKWTTSNKPPPPLEEFTEIECPRCNSQIVVQGLDKVNVQETLFSRQWGLNRCATYCPVCNEVISGIAAF
jgi:hypothetical protein